MQRAAELEKSGRLEDAIREQDAALAVDAVNVQAHVNLIALYGRTGNPGKAREHFAAAIRLSPGRSDAWYNYGVLLLREGSATEEAEHAFRRALELNPDNSEASDNLGVIYERQGRLDDAAREFRHAVASRPDFPLARFHLGRVLANQKRYEESVQQFLRALNPESDRTPTYIYALAATLARAGRREEALTYYQRARDAALARGQSQLLDSIERDMNTLRTER
jgi:Tfp pilus assembly protein PilF